ncbi:hypothetical protein E4U32_000638 [Claviceps aff. humidiphila group G2b]|nr:hypothetical protein E4U32_000638 [Claviceps aff. humidiphila group G2b]
MAIWMPQKVTVFRITGLDGDSIWTSIFGWMRLLIWAKFKIMNADKARSVQLAQKMMRPQGLAPPGIVALLQSDFCLHSDISARL